MSLKVNQIGTVTVNATKAGNPGSYERINAVVLSVPEAGVPTISEDGLSATIAWSATATADFTVSVDIDNVSGEGGSLVLVSDPISTVDALLADGGTVVIS